MLFMSFLQLLLRSTIGQKHHLFIGKLIAVFVWWKNWYDTGRHCVRIRNGLLDQAKRHARDSMASRCRRTRREYCDCVRWPYDTCSHFRDGGMSYILALNGPVDVGAVAESRTQRPWHDCNQRCAFKSIKFSKFRKRSLSNMSIFALMYTL
jgi:hypothetical protein